MKLLPEHQLILRGYCWSWLGAVIGALVMTSSGFVSLVTEGMEYSGLGGYEKQFWLGAMCGAVTFGVIYTHVQARKAEGKRYQRLILGCVAAFIAVILGNYAQLYDRSWIFPLLIALPPLAMAYLPKKIVV